MADDIEVVGRIRVTDDGTVKIENFNKALGKTQDQSSRSSKGITALGQAAAKIHQPFIQLGRIFEVAFGNLLSKGLDKITSGLKGVWDGAMEMNSGLEKSTLQFTTLLGSTQAAESHIKSLYDFAAKTPFETGPVIEASKKLLTFGGTALDTMENLTKFGNAAAITNQPIEDISFWMGRAYSAIQGGRPFGEAAMRLQEMGILTADTRTKLEAMQKQGKKGAEVWNVLSSEFGRFDGAMTKQAGTMEGLTSTLKDNFGMLTGKILSPFFELIKGGTQVLIDFVSSSNIQAWADGIASSMTQMAPFVKGAFAAIGKGDILGALDQIAGGVDTAFGPAAVQPLIDFRRAFAGILDAFTVGLGPENDWLAAITNVMYFLDDSIPGMADFGDAILNVVGVFQESMPQIQATFAGMANFLITTWQTVGPILLGSITGALNQIAAFWKDHGAQVMAIVDFLWKVLVVVVSGSLIILGGIVQSGLAILDGLFNAFSLISQGRWSELWQNNQNVLQQVTGFMTTAFENFMNLVLSIVGTNLTQFNATWSKNFEMAHTILTTIFNKATTFLKGLVGDWIKVGGDLIEGLRIGMQNKINAFTQWLKDTLAQVTKLVHQIFGARSPSTVFMGIGEDLMKGLQIGIQAALPNTLDITGSAMRSVSSSMVDSHNMTNNFVFPDGASRSRPSWFNDRDFSRLTSMAGNVA